MTKQFKTIDHALTEIVEKVEKTLREEEHKEALYDKIAQIDDLIYEIKREYNEFQQEEDADPPEPFYFNYSRNGVSEKDFF